MREVENDKIKSSEKFFSLLGEGNKNEEGKNIFTGKKKLVQNIHPWFEAKNRLLEEETKRKSEKIVRLQKSMKAKEVRNDVRKRVLKRKVGINFKSESFIMVGP